MASSEYKPKRISKNKKINKYNAVPCTVDNIRFHSTAEAKRYKFLKNQEKLNKISNLQLQVPFVLSEPETIKYIADFTYYKDGIFIVEDVKSPLLAKTEVWKIKSKLFFNKNSFYIKVVHPYKVLIL